MPKPTHPLISYELANESLTYDPVTGFLTWKVRPDHHFISPRKAAAWNKRWAGVPIIYVHKIGYIMVAIRGYAATSAHRIAWLLMTGAYPKDQIDHINGARSDNRWENLRDVPATLNQRNKVIGKNNTSGIVGVAWDKGAGKWMATGVSGGKPLILGRFASKEDAAAVRAEWAAANGFHANHGRP
jgi:hypothetical protein